MNKIGLVITAAGSSVRFGKPKLLQFLGDLPVFCHSLRNLSRLAEISRTALVIPEDLEPVFTQFIHQFIPDLADSVLIVHGGQCRTDSVHNGILALPDDLEFIAVHDAARPLATFSLLRHCLEEAEEYGAAIAAHKIVDTVKLAGNDKIIGKTIDRTALWGAETPQVARRSLFLKAYSHLAQHPELGTPTDEAQLLEFAGIPVRLVESVFPNPKLTTPADLTTIKAML